MQCSGFPLTISSPLIWLKSYIRISYDSKSIKAWIHSAIFSGFSDSSSLRRAEKSKLG